MHALHSYVLNLHKNHKTFDQFTRISFWKSQMKCIFFRPLCICGSEQEGGDRHPRKSLLFLRQKRARKQTVKQITSPHRIPLDIKTDFFPFIHFKIKA